MDGAFVLGTGTDLPYASGGNDGTFGTSALRRGLEVIDTFRASTRTQLTDFLVDGRGGTLALFGLHGAGKGRLLNAVERETAERLPTSKLRANPAERHWPLSGVSAFVARLQLDTTDEFEALLHTPGSEFRDTSSIASELATLVRESHKAQAIIVHDFDDFDPGSQEVLGFVLHRLTGTNLRVVVSVSGTGLPASLAGTHAIRLGPLTTSQLTDVAAAVAGPGASAHVLRLVALQGHGNPMSTLQALHRLSRSQIHGHDPLTFPLAVGALESSIFGSRLDEMPDEQKWLLRVLSSAPDLPRALVASFSNEADDALRALQDAGWVGHSPRGSKWVSIRDPRLRSLSYWSMSSDQSRLLHRQLAERCAGEWPDQAVVHRSLAEPASISTTELLESAIHQVADGANWAALEAAERGLSVGTRGRAGVGEQLVLLAQGFATAAETPFAARYTQLAKSLEMPAEHRIHLALLRSGTAMPSGPRRLSGTVLDTAATLGHSAPDVAIQALSFDAFTSLESWDPEAAEQLLTAGDGWLPQATADGKKLHRAVGHALEAFRGRGSPATIPDGFESELENGGLRAIALVIEARALSHGGHYMAARVLFEQLTSLPGRALPPIWNQTAQAFSAENELLSGNHGMALLLADSLLEDSDEHLHFAPAASILRLWRSQAIGSENMPDLLPTPLRQGSSLEAYPGLAARVSALEGTTALMLGRYDLAATRLRAALRLSAMIGSAPHLLRCTPDLVEALVLGGHAEEATRVAHEFFKQAANHTGRWMHLASARIIALTAGPSKIDDAYAKLHRLWTPVDGHYELGRIGYAHARQLTMAGRAGEARSELAAARANFDAAGAVPWAHRCTVPWPRETSEAGPEVQPSTQSAVWVAAAQHADSVPGTGTELIRQLTDDERLVVKRVLHGKKNREIADELYVSARTVEVRLTSVYRKLGARSRAHLAWMLSPAS